MHTASICLRHTSHVRQVGCQVLVMETAVLLWCLRAAYAEGLLRRLRNLSIRMHFCFGHRLEAEAAQNAADEEQKRKAAEAAAQEAARLEATK